MKKTFTINISGTIFHIEEDAYEKLQNYLISLKNHFGANEEGNEIIADFENRIAELFSEKLKTDQEAITLDWVTEVIETMGTPDDFIKAEEEAVFETAKRKKRLYRDPEKLVIGGVCSGLGAYFNIDPVIVRIVMVILALFNGVGLIAYLVLWIAVPKPVTNAQRLEMRGREVTVTNIEQSIRDEVKDMKEGVRKIKESETFAKGKEKASEAGEVVSNVFGVILKAFVIIFGILLIMTGFFGLLGFISSLVIGQSFISGWPLGWDSGVQVPEFISHFVSHEALTWGLLSIGFLIGIPLLLLLFVGTKLVFRYRSNNAVIVLTMVGLWLVALIVLMSVSVGQIGNFKDISTASENRSVSCGNCKTLYLNLGEDKYKDQRDANWNFENYRVVEVDGKEIMLGEPRLDVEKASSDEFSIVIKTSSRGKTRDAAKETSSDVEYNYVVKDSTVIFDPYFILGESSKWRNQKVNITLKVPVGKSVFLGKDMTEIIYDIENITNTWDGDMIGKKWEMTTEGLTLKEN